MQRLQGADGETDGEGCCAIFVHAWAGWVLVQRKTCAAVLPPLLQWPHLQALAQATAECGKALLPRLVAGTHTPFARLNAFPPFLAHCCTALC